MFFVSTNLFSYMFGQWRLRSEWTTTIIWFGAAVDSRLTKVFISMDPTIFERWPDSLSKPQLFVQLGIGFSRWGYTSFTILTVSLSLTIANSLYHHVVVFRHLSGNSVCQFFYHTKESTITGMIKSYLRLAI